VAGSARFTAILDANVFYPRLIRDTDFYCDKK
jgi:hypothetical protein